MTRLASPEVLVDEKMSGLTIFRQKTATPADNDNTDVGINDALGLNVISTAIDLYLVTPSSNPETTLRMTIRLNEAWAETGAFIEDMKNTHNVDVSLFVNPLDETQTALSVTGLNDIEKLADVFRGTQFVSQHEGADIYRQMVNPALLGETLDRAEKVVAAYKGRKTDNWAEQFAGYGWLLK